MALRERQGVVSHVVAHCLLKVICNVASWRGPGYRRAPSKIWKGNCCEVEVIWELNFDIVIVCRVGIRNGLSTKFELPDSDSKPEPQD